jgi:F0F1-type ATP synthase membrane subunit b/b'
MNGGSGLYEQVALWSQVLGSVAFLVVLVYLFRRFVAPAVVASQARKNAELLEIEQRRDAAKAEVEVARRALVGAQDDVRAIGERARIDAEREGGRMIAEAKSEGERLVRNAEGELERGRAAARVALRDELLEKALAIARQSAPRRIDEKKDRELVAGVLASIHHEKETKRP